LGIKLINPVRGSRGALNPALAKTDQYSSHDKPLGVLLLTG